MRAGLDFSRNSPLDCPSGLPSDADETGKKGFTMARLNYHQGRSSSDTTRRGAKFWYVSNGRLKGVSADRCGGRLYLGVELEVDGFSSDSRAVNVTNKVDEILGQYAVCVYDGSLCNGFEIVFDPMTLGAFDHNRDVVFVEDTVTEVYCNTDCTCGLQFVINWWTKDEILATYADWHVSADGFWNALTDSAHQYIVDVPSDDAYYIEDGADWACELMCDADIVATQSTLFTAENMEKLVEIVKGVSA